MYDSIYIDVVIHNPWHAIVPMFEALDLSGTIQLTTTPHCYLHITGQTVNLSRKRCILTLT